MVKALLRRKGSGVGRKFTRNFSKINTLPIQMSLTLVEKLVGTTSVGLWFRILSLLGGRHKEGRIRGTGRDPAYLKHQKGEALEGRGSDLGEFGFSISDILSLRLHQSGFKYWNLKAFGAIKSRNLKPFSEDPAARNPTGSHVDSSGGGSCLSRLCL